jgi:hypothetical protein
MHAIKSKFQLQIRAGLVAANCMALAACGTIGNYTNYNVACDDSKDVRPAMKTVATKVEALTGVQPKTWDFKDSLSFVFVLSSDLLHGTTYSIHISSVEVGKYFVYVGRAGDKAESSEVTNARDVIEQAISGTPCPRFDRKIETYQPARTFS